MGGKQLKRVAFTLHDYTLADVKRILHISSVYCILGYEVCPETKRKHIQGFINLTKKETFPKIKALIGLKAHIEAAKGTDEQNRTYCSKDGEFTEVGTPSQQGRRNDILLAVETLHKNNGDTQKVAVLHPEVFIRYHRGLQAYANAACPAPDRNFKTEVHVYIGEPGAGKSRHAQEQAALIGTSYYKPRGDWWDGYNHQPVVVIDDFYGWLKFDELLKICDRYPYRVPIKGGYVVFNSTHIFITSNVEIPSWYKFQNYDPRALFRRLTSYKRFERNELNNFNQLFVYSMHNIHEHINY